MKHNTADVAALDPDYLGFIFFEKSPRNYDLNEIPELHSGIKKVGVFVNAELDFVLEKVRQFGFEVIQLHGNESPEYCTELKTRHAELVSASHPNLGMPVPSPIEVPALSSIEVWKVFSIKDSFDFSVLKEYEPVVDKFLFDTKGKEKGGNGYTFDWNVLKDYPSSKPFILSGGIGLEEIDSVRELMQTDLPLYAIDVNSKFEDQPGLKNIENLKKLIDSFTPTKRT
ncbi:MULTISPECIES: phosphoribosylanthranilate isomerase [unclassified Leeuwenhoekiella]|uniref:phosphoribosylanthranilate isomerase n=1 Tax=unclassified Leeuwenhoekiella TaxID=2615029 RepID=UPI000C51C3B1|nr:MULTISPECIES: phosphoribosylanthranilate isomerase [unclassified Leeuwenhoekiella]MAU70463.1 N-(5'-phosphoribosyl)anthranilate isomerase [Pseudozobellia sp.]MAW97114.1 N-(5'-phosphoribosyl)anthranilate isomerase [Leeuwenhoekiella sp.]MBA82630.1 N-(5'-phosphoribosyl)anthranilate isomerase [Leeuwenhoekiella sp.]